MTDDNSIIICATKYVNGIFYNYIDKAYYEIGQWKIESTGCMCVI